MFVRRSAWSVCLVLLGVAGSERPAFAQRQPAPGSLTDALIGFARDSDRVTGVSLPQHTGQALALAELVSLEVATAPYGTSTGAFSYVFDPELGTLTRQTRSFGPAFAKRSLTSGRGRYSLGLNVLAASYDSINGSDMSDGSLKLVRNGTNLPPQIPSGASITLDLDSQVTAAFFAAGVTDNIDVGVVVPWVRVRLGAVSRLESSTGGNITPGGALVFPARSSSGLGDAALFAKYHFWRRGPGGVAAEVNMRIPTGDPDNLRGVDATRTLTSLIWSHGGRLSPHASGGFEYWSSPVPISEDGLVYARHQIDYAAGIEFQAHPRVTAVADLIGRRQLHGGRADYETIPIGPGTIDVLRPISESLDVVSFAPGVKWNFGGDMLLSGNVLVSLANRGVRANFVPAFGVEWAF